MAGIELQAEPRSIVGKKVRFLRREGVVPGNVYGHSASTAIQIPAKELETTIRRAGRTQLVSLAIAGSEPTTVLVKTWQRHPYKGTLLHVDFYRVAMTQRLRMDVPIRLTGESPATKSANGTPFQTQATLSIECLPADIPESIEVDLSTLEEIDSSVFVRDLVVPEGVTVLTDGDEMIVRIMAPTVEPDVTEAPAEGAGEPTATAEGEQPAGDESSDE